MYSTFVFTDDRHKTAFHMRTGQLDYTCMPFRLINAPAELQRQFNRDLDEPVRQGWMGVYMDDVQAYSKSLQEHMQHLREKQ